jgi:hypothetical protein
VWHNSAGETYGFYDGIYLLPDEYIPELCFPLRQLLVYKDQHKSMLFLCQSTMARDPLPDKSNSIYQA